MEYAYDVLVPFEWAGENSFPTSLDDDIEIIINNLHETLIPLMRENALQEARAIEVAKKLILV